MDELVTVSAEAWNAMVAPGDSVRFWIESKSGVPSYGVTDGPARQVRPKIALVDVSFGRAFKLRRAVPVSHVQRCEVLNELRGRA